VAFGGGAAIYFGLMDEPPLWLAVIATGLALVGVTMARRRLAPPAVIIAAALAAFLAAGFLTAKVRTLNAAHPILAPQQAAQVDGWVVDVAPPSESGQRLVIAPVAIRGVADHRLPHRVRVTIDPENLIGPGAAIRLRAGLNPPPPPAAPGAYDFAEGAYFDGVGGVGFALTPPQVITLPEPPLAFRWLLAVNEARWRLTLRVQEQIGGAAGGLAAAMITGHSAFVPIPDSDAMRDAGISHIISISGLHMAIVGGFVFFAVRLGLATWPAVALRINVKKAAAVAGLLAITVYLVVSGAPPAAERAAITASVAFGAILIDRRAVTLRGLALAALIVIALQPEAVTEPGFQMSFAATAALVALAEAWPRGAREINTPWPITLVQRAVQWVLLSIGVSFVAGLATAPFVIQHFNRVAVYSLPANLLVAPLSSFVFMPALAIGAALEPLGLGRPFLMIAGWGIQLMLDLANRVASVPGASATVASAPDIALPIAFLGILWMCLWHGRGRWLGLPAALAVMLWPRPPTPDLWIAADGVAAAVSQDGKALLMRPDSRRFASDLWARRRGLDIVEDPAALAVHFDCARWSCRSRPGQRLQVAGWWTRRAPKPDQLAALCAGAQLLIIKAEVQSLPASCAGVKVLRPADFAAGGAAELYRTEDGWRIVWAQPLRGRRPWTAPAVGPEASGSGA
jgi:competence protein ComEC